MVNFKTIKDELEIYTYDEMDGIANLANFSSILFHHLGDIAWAGFYLLKDDELVLGPFQGRPACTRIRFGEGVCGTAWKEGETQRIYDVTKVENHIFCDNNTRSELVIPLYNKEEFVGVLDLDSYKVGRFSEEDEMHLEELVELFMEFSWR